VETAERGSQTAPGLSEPEFSAPPYEQPRLGTSPVQSRPLVPIVNPEVRLCLIVGSSILELREWMLHKSIFWATQQPGAIPLVGPGHLK